MGDAAKPSESLCLNEVKNRMQASALSYASAVLGHVWVPGCRVCWASFRFLRAWGEVSLWRRVQGLQGSRVSGVVLREMKAVLKERLEHEV